MPKTIQELRRERGYRSAREFADALGISPSSMSRYDNQPDSIPTKVAWEMADKLGCSIDEVVGRKLVTSGRSELQEFYDGLHRWNKDLFDEFREFIEAREKRASSLEKTVVERKYERMAQYFERMFFQEFFDHVDVEDLDALDHPWAVRDGIESYVLDRLEESRARKADKAAKTRIDKMRAAGWKGAPTVIDGIEWDPNDPEYTTALYPKILNEEVVRIDTEETSIKEVTQKIMEAYDRLHPEEEYAFFHMDGLPK